MPSFENTDPKVRELARLLGEDCEPGNYFIMLALRSTDGGSLVFVPDASPREAVRVLRTMADSIEEREN